MKICYISNSAAPSKNASSLQIAKLCETFSSLGHKVQLIIPNTGLKEKNFFNFYNIRKKYAIKRINFFKKFPTGFSYYLYSFVAVISSNYKNQDLFITRNFFTSLILSLLKKKHIIEVHDSLEIEGRIVRFLVRYFKILNFDSIIKIISTTKTLKKKYIIDGVDKKKIFVLHNASGFQSRFSKNKYQKNLKIGYFGSLFDSRGLKMLLKLSNLDRRNNYYLFGGSKEEVREMKKKVKNNNIFFSSHISYSNVEKEINKVDLCLLPYTSKITVSGNVGDISKYTSPLKIFDYMKLGKLIVCSNLPVLREVLINKKNCILINNFKNEKEWIMTINKVTHNFKKFTKIRKNAFNYAKRFDLNWRVKKILSFYKFQN